MINSLLVNIPPLTLDAAVAAGRLLPVMALGGAELTLTEVAPEYFAASYRLPWSQLPPVSVVGTSMADCLTQLADRLAPLQPPGSEQEPEA